MKHVKHTNILKHAKHGILWSTPSRQVHKKLKAREHVKHPSTLSMWARQARKAHKTHKYASTSFSRLQPASMKLQEIFFWYHTEYNS